MIKLSALLISPSIIDNLAHCVRTAQLTGISPVYIYDSELLLSRKERRKQSSYQKGVVERHDVRAISSPIKFLDKNRRGYRKIATVVEEGMPLCDFRYNSNDLLVFGNEKNGLDSEVFSLCDEVVTLPSLEDKNFQCYTLVSAFSMFAYEFMRQSNF